MKVGKPQSKRVPVRLRNKIQKKSAAKQRKERKAAKTNPQWKSRLKKDPGIPNLFPYKAKVLAEIEEQKRRKEEEQMQKRELAKARRMGQSVEATTAELMDEDENDDEEDGGVKVIHEEDDDMDVEDANPMAALLASARTRAQDFGTEDGGGDFEEDEEEIEDEDDEVPELVTAKPVQEKKGIPQKALDDPVKAVQLLIAKLEDTMGGVEALIAHYQIPPLVTAGSDMHTRFLVEVARKRGRLGRGGIPNLEAAAMLVLSDLHEERLKLPTTPVQTEVSSVAAPPAATMKSTIVKTLAAPFKLAGLWGDNA